MSTKKNVKRQKRDRVKRPLLLNITAVGVFALAAATLYASASQNEGARVEQFVHLHGLAIAPWAPEEIYLSTHQGLIRIDAEGNWRFISKLPHDFMGFQVNPTEENVLYSSGHPAPGSNLSNPLGFMVSRDAGETWQPIALEGQTDFHAMAVQPSNGDIIYGWSGGLYRSLDGGKTWEMRPSEGLIQLRGALSLAVHSEDSETLLAGTQHGLWGSTDGGASWEPLLPDIPVTAVTYAPDNAEHIFAYGAHPEAGLLLSEDGGASWARLDLVLENNDAVGYIALHPMKEGVMYLGSYGQDLFKTTDGGQSWEQLAVRGVPTQE